MARQTLENVQILRFMAAGGVLISHTADLTIPHHSPLWAVRWTSGVDIFFVISGFIMTYLTIGCFGDGVAARSFLVRRIIRIVPPYWFFTTLMVAVALALPAHVKHNALTPFQLVANYAFVPWPRSDGRLNPILSQGWTLNYEAFFYLAFTFAMLSRRGLAWLAGLFVAFVAAHFWISRSLFVLSFWSDPIILEFLVGIGLALLFTSGRRLPLWASAVLSLGALILFVGPTVRVPRFQRLVEQGLPAALLCAGFILGPEPRHAGPLRRALVRGGDASYTLYLSHTLTINAMIVLWGKARLGLPWLELLVAMAVAVAVAQLLYHWLERPVTDLLQRTARVKPIRGAAEVAP